MRYYLYSKKQLEQVAENLLCKYDAERLEKIKPLDVYDVIEKCLGVSYDWKYLTPDQSILGLTAFQDGYTWVWPESQYHEGLIPKKLYLKKGTIVIDATLTEQNNRGRENFTVMHEVFHQVLHTKCFRGDSANTAHATYGKVINGYTNYKNEALSRIEWQANYCAAAFLMPRALTTRIYRERYWFAQHDPYRFWKMDDILKPIADDMGVSRQALEIRLKELGLIAELEGKY